jgi:pimeloyl-ACP methyl ester carboxylesterase
MCRRPLYIDRIATDEPAQDDPLDAATRPERKRSDRRAPRLDRLPYERLPDASHWVHHDEAERVNQLLSDFFAPAPVA